MFDIEGMKKIKKTSKKKPIVGKKVVLKKKPASKKKTVKKTTRPELSRRIKPTKRLVKKLIASVVKPKSRLTRLGKVIHYYNHIKVGIVKLSAPLSEGQKIQFRGATTDFSQTVKSIQINHEAVKKAKKGQIIGLKASKRVRQGDEMYAG